MRTLTTRSRLPRSLHPAGVWARDRHQVSQEEPVCSEGEVGRFDMFGHHRHVNPRQLSCGRLRPVPELLPDLPVLVCCPLLGWLLWASCRHRVNSPDLRGCYFCETAPQHQGRGDSPSLCVENGLLPGLGNYLQCKPPATPVTLGQLLTFP